MAAPRILSLDIETSPAAAYVWRLYGDQNISLNQIADPGGVIMVGAKWHGEKPVTILSVPADGVKGMARKVRDLLDEADQVVTWNGQSFDLPHLNTLGFRLGLRKPSPYQSVDLFRVVKREHKSLSNKLDYWAQALGVGSKQKTGGFDLWLGCMDGDPKAWARMGRYCAQDVRLTEQLYDRFAATGWLGSALPHRALFDGDPNGCPACGSSRYQRRGVSRTKVSQYRRYQCRDCGQWFRGLALDKPRPATRPV